MAKKKQQKLAKIEEKSVRPGKKNKADKIDAAKLPVKAATKAEPKTTDNIHAAEIKRLNRVTGQVEGIANMLGQGRKVNDVLIQFKAVHSALKSIEQRLFEQYVEQSVSDIVSADKRKERESKIIELQGLFKVS